jgi:hypothetical protein
MYAMPKLPTSISGIEISPLGVQGHFHFENFKTLIILISAGPNDIVNFFLRTPNPIKLAIL